MEAIISILVCLLVALGVPALIIWFWDKEVVPPATPKNKWSSTPSLKGN